MQSVPERRQTDDLHRDQLLHELVDRLQCAHPVERSLPHVALDADEEKGSLIHTLRTNVLYAACICMALAEDDLGA